jgi:hypothetical protein
VKDAVRGFLKEHWGELTVLENGYQLGFRKEVP